MKEELITVRITEHIKNEFKEISEYEGTTMSQKIHDFINHEVLVKKRYTKENEFMGFLKNLGYNNITIVDSPLFRINDEGKLLNPDIDEGRIIQIESYNGDILDYLHMNKNNQIYYYIEGSNAESNSYRLWAYDKKRVN